MKFQKIVLLLQYKKTKPQNSMILQSFAVLQLIYPLQGAYFIKLRRYDNCVGFNTTIL